MNERFNKRAAIEDRIRIDLVVDQATGTIVVEDYALNGKAGRLNSGPSFIKRDAKTGIIVQESWYKDGLLHREDGPARTTRDRTTGNVLFEEWFLMGEPTVPKAAQASCTAIPALA